jgi:hypothetical protein
LSVKDIDEPMEHSLRDRQKSDDCGIVLPYARSEKGMGKGGIDKMGEETLFCK